MAINFGGKVALVTGAGKGIGRGIAKMLSKYGAQTIAISRTQEDLDTLRLEVPKIQVHQINLANWEDTRELVQSLAPVDLLVNNAAIVKKESFIETTKQSLDEIFEVNFKAVVNVSQVVSQSMLKRGVPGSIVHVTSISSNFVIDEHSAYSSSKSAVHMLTRAMASELGPFGIRVNSVSPGITLTDMVMISVGGDLKLFDPYLSRSALRRFSKVDDIANSVVFLLSDMAGNITGENIKVDGGLTIN